MVKQTGEISKDSSGSNLTGSFSSGAYTETIDTLNFTGFELLMSETSSNFDTIIIQVSIDDITWINLSEIYQSDINSQYIREFSLNNKPWRYYRLYNSSPSSISFNKILYGLLA
ncbi:MAG: hypothetical protein P1U85_21235 [Verrucomicrobiales bacterium]|nr:hypothetical protein [Verrucomicrobiales bacterium]